MHPDDREWLIGLVEMATEIHRTLLTDTGIFSLSETPDHPLMWAHYAASHSGFCVGYVWPVGIDSPRNIYKINYAGSVPPVTPRKLVHDPHDALMDRVLTKPADWAYEREWRVTLGSIAGVVENWLAPRRVISVLESGVGRNRPYGTSSHTMQLSLCACIRGSTSDPIGLSCSPHEANLGRSKGRVSSSSAAIGRALLWKICPSSFSPGSLRVEKRLQQVVPLGRNRVGPITRNLAISY